MKKTLLIVLPCIALGIFAGCMQSTTPHTSSVSNSPAGSSAATDAGVIQEIDALWEQLDTTPLARKEGGINYWWNQLQNRVPEQPLFPNDETAQQLTVALWRLLGRDGNKLPDFDKGTTLVLDEPIVETILYNLAPLDLPQRSFSSPEDIGYPNHIVTASLCQYLQDGNYIVDVYYSDDMKKAAHYLFGDNISFPKYREQDAYAYLGRSDIFVKNIEFGGPVFRYPLIMEYQETDEGCKCQVIIAQAVFKDEPVFIGTPENPVDINKLQQETAHEYTFEKASDGHLVLVSHKTL